MIPSKLLIFITEEIFKYLNTFGELDNLIFEQQTIQIKDKRYCNMNAYVQVFNDSIEISNDLSNDPDIVDYEDINWLEKIKSLLDKHLLEINNWYEELDKQHGEGEWDLPTKRIG